MIITKLPKHSMLTFDIPTQYNTINKDIFEKKYKMYLENCKNLIF